MGQQYLFNNHTSAAPVDKRSMRELLQQIFYRLEENISGCYAQKPLKAIKRIIAASSSKNQRVLDCFSHSGTTLLAAERLGRIGITFDIDPVFAELTIRRLENYRTMQRPGWQRENPFSQAGELSQ